MSFLAKIFSKKGVEAVGDTVEKAGSLILQGKERKHGNKEKDAQRAHDMELSLLDYRKKFSSGLIFSAISWQFVILLGIWFTSPILGRIPFLNGILADYNDLINAFGASNLIIVIMSLLGIKKGFNAWQNGQQVSFAKKLIEKEEKPKKVSYDYDALIEKHFSKRSKDRLKTCHKDLIKVFAVVCSRFDISVLEGTRSLEDQQKYFRDGKSKLDGIKKKSKHQSNPSMAVDVAPYPIDWDNSDRFIKLSEVVFSVANELKEAGEINHRIRWGGDFNQDGNYTNDNFVDMPHWELS